MKVEYFSTLCNAIQINLTTTNKFNNHNQKTVHCNHKHNAFQIKCKVQLFNLRVIIEKDNKIRGGGETKKTKKINKIGHNNKPKKEKKFKIHI